MFDVSISTSAFLINPAILLTKFPSLSASSLLCLSTKAFSEKSPSSPKGVALNKKYLAESTPAIEINSSTFITFPLDFDIFSLSNVHQP